MKTTLMKLHKTFTPKLLMWILAAVVCITSSNVLPIFANPAPQSFAPVDDSFVRSGSKYQDDNYNNETTLTLKRATAENYRKAFMKFDLSSLGRSVAVTKATLTLYGYAQVNPYDIGIYRLDDDTWAENTITWNNAPEMAYEASTQIGTVTIKNTTSNSFKPFTVDLTSYVAEQTESGDYLISIGLDSITYNNTCTLSSREYATTALVPQLTVECVESGPRVKQTIPKDGSKLYKNSSAYIDFDCDMDAESITDHANVLVEPAVNYTLSYDDVQRRCNITFPDGLAEAEYTITLKAGTIKSADQKPLASDKTIRFTATADPWDTQGIIITQHADSAYADAQLTNNMSIPSKATIIITLYEKETGALVDIKIEPYTIDAGATTKIKTPVIYVPDELEKYFFRSFFWNDLKNLNPITDSVDADNFQAFDVMRDKMKGLLTGGFYYDLDDPDVIKNNTEATQSAQQLWNTMDKKTGRTALWSTLKLGSSDVNILTTYGNLKTMAIAYATVGSELYRNQDLLQDIISGLEWMEQNIYNPAIATYGNWWYWEIGIPIEINDTVVLVYDELTKEQRTRYMQAVAHFQPSITQTGANRMWECKIFAGRGLILNDPDLITVACEGLAPLLVMSTSGDGFYNDGSFIQHNAIPYNGGYGKSLLHEVTGLLFAMEGSPWEIDEASKDIVCSWVYNSFKPFIYKGAFMDMVRGREIARNYAETYQVGHSVISDILRLSQIMPKEHSKAFQSTVKHWIQESTAKSYFDNAPNDMIVLAKSILNDSSIEPEGDLIGYRQFYNMDRAVQIRPDYGVGISMFSNRIYNYEMINEENIKGYHTSDGAVYLYNNDLLQYSDNFWPTVNKYRIPGTTVLAGTSVSANVRGDRTWVGGVKLADFGVSGMDLHTYGKTLEAKKSWFMFDNEIVALGTGINSTDDIITETIIENRKINGDNQFVVNGLQKPTSLSWSEVIEDTDWAHLQGNVQGADIGYYFPLGANVNMIREARSGSWADMRKAGPSTNMTANYLTMWFDHGKNPENKAYSYVILPNMTQEQTHNYAQNPDIVIISNSAYVQAVKDIKLNMTGANFWTDTLQSVDKITCDKKASVMMKQTNEEIEISVSDPTQLNTGNIQIEINQSATGIISADANITIEQLTPTIKLSVNTKGSKGESFQAKFSLR